MTHASTTDADARLAKKSLGSEAKLAFTGHLLMENRNGLVVDARLTPATGTAEREAALDMLGDLPAGGRVTVGADKAYESYTADRATLFGRYYGLWSHQHSCCSGSYICEFDHWLLDLGMYCDKITILSFWILTTTGAPQPPVERSATRSLGARLPRQSPPPQRG